MDNIKQFASRVQLWVKANPKKAAVIGLIIVIVAYFAIKKGATESGDSMSAESSGESSLDAMGAGLSGIESGGAFTGGGSVSSSTPSVESSGGGNGGGNGDGSILDSFSMDNGGGFASDFSLTPSGYSGSTSSIVNNPVGANIQPSPVARVAERATAINPSVKTSTLTAPSKTATATATRSGGKVNTSAMTPAQRVGKGRLFTGTYNGIRYVAGYPVGTVAQNNPMSLNNTSVGIAKGANLKQF